MKNNQLNYGSKLKSISVQISSATRDLMLIQQNKFYWISSRSGVAELVWTVTLKSKRQFHFC